MTGAAADPTSSRSVAILLFDEVEVLDFAGPFEVFSVTGRRQGREPFMVSTVGASGDAIRARNGLTVVPRFSFDNCSRADILIVPGGYGTRREMKNPLLLDWVRSVAGDAELLLSVCTGALILGAAGLLDGQTATTHFMAFDELRTAAPRSVIRDQRIVDNGRIVLSAGVSAGIDMSLHVVSRLLGADVAAETARYMEYDGRWRLA
ncbi:MAG: DJ-1/PfpI family protein [Gemmatimonadota bacterium]